MARRERPSAGAESEVQQTLTPHCRSGYFPAGNVRPRASVCTQRDPSTGVPESPAFHCATQSEVLRSLYQ